MQSQRKQYNTSYAPFEPLPIRNIIPIDVITKFHLERFYNLESRPVIKVEPEPMIKDEKAINIKVNTSVNNFIKKYAELNNIWIGNINADMFYKFCDRLDYYRDAIKYITKPIVGVSSTYDKYYRTIMSIIKPSTNPNNFIRMLVLHSDIKPDQLTGNIDSDSKLVVDQYTGWGELYESDHSSTQSLCSCGHTIHEIFVITCATNGNTLQVGNDCINRALMINVHRKQLTNRYKQLMNRYNHL